MIKITARAIVDQSFIDLEREVYEDFLRHEKAAARMYPAGSAQFLKLRAPAHARVLSVIRTDHSEGRSGAEYEMTRLRALPYTRFTAVTHNEKSYLVGITKPITITETTPAVTRRGHIVHPAGDVYSYYLGSYAIYLPTHDLVSNQVDHFHFIPMKCPNSLARHFHHTAIERWARTNNEDTHPLDMAVKTCWGGFGPSVNSLVSICDIPELFRTLQIYLSRHDPSSPLVRPEEFDFDINIPEAE